MKNTTHSSPTSRLCPRSLYFTLLAAFTLLLGGRERGAAQTFPGQGDDTTPSMGVFRITVDPAFRSLMSPSGALVAYSGYRIADGKLTSPLCIDNATTIGRSNPNSRFYAFPQPVGLGSWDVINGYGDYPAIPFLWFAAPAPTEEVLTEIKSFALLSVGGGTAGQHCPPDPRIPTVPVQWPMVKAGTFAGISPRSLGMVQENVANGAANPDFPAHSFFDIFVEVNLPPLPGTVSGTAFPVTGAVLYNDTPLIITNLNLTSFPPSVIYIHGETLAVPVKFKAANPPYWNANDIFGYLVLAGHGTITNDCSDPNGQAALLDAVLGPIGTSKPEMPIEWPRTNTLCPSDGATYDSVTDDDIINFTIPGGPTLHTRNFVHGNLLNPITPPALNATSIYASPNTFVTLELSLDGLTWSTAVANGGVQTKITHTSDTGGTAFFDTEMLALNLNGNGPFGPFMLRESPTKQSLGKHTIRPDGTVFRISSFFDVFLELSTDGGLSWIPADRAVRVQPSPPPVPPITLNCSSNITVTASSAAGAVVNFTVTANGACAPVNVVANPPSGSTFPIGTTTVTVTATDGCGNVADCSFTVTVLPPVPTVPEYFEPTNSLPPTNSVYISPALWHQLYASGIIIRDVRHRFFTQNFTPPALGAPPQTEQFSSEVDFDLSTDNGATFQPANATANVTVQVTHSSDSTSTSFFDTEMLQLDISGGSLPTGMQLRESPTLQSTGHTTIRTVPGGYMISSFFDIFTELSTDGGLSWQPAQQPGHVELRPDPRAQGNVVSEPTTLLPPPNDKYVSPEQWHALYAQGIVIKDVSHKLFTTPKQSPPAGGTNNEVFDSTLDLQVSTDGGNTFQFVRVAAPVSVTVASRSSGSDPLFDTEMTGLSASLPNGVMIRESPTEPSRGMTAIRAQADGTYKINSFFDIFTELSLDGGASWSPATNGPVRMQLTQLAPEVPKPTSDLPPQDGSYVSPAQWHALYANGIIITNASHDRFTQTQPPPPAGGTNLETFGSQVTGQISMDGGASFTPFSAPASVAVLVSSRPALDTGNTRFFDTEMLSLNLAGGTLPGGIMVRESPSKASLGKTSVRTTPGGYMISSFFDIFTEVSLDGGQTWSPQVNGPGTLGLTTNPPPTCIVDITCPASITVTSVGPAVVNFVVTASDTCNSPVTIISVPPSGSTFPIGTTTVTNTAINADGTATCTFTVTVISKQRAFPSGGNLPPTNSVYISPAMWHAAYANGIYISNVVHRAFTANFPPPTSGSTSNETFGSKVDFQFSPDGKSFQKFTGNADCTVKVTSLGGSGKDQVYQTEMLQLDLSGGNMPAGVRLRESPTKQSLGQTRITASSGGGFMISSFFDIWTELSLDGGQTWLPSSSAGHMELHIDPANPPTALVQPQFQGTHISFDVPTQPGLRYTVQFSGDLASPDWSVLTVVSGNGQSLMVDDPLVGNPSHRFYRVIIDEDPNQ